MSTLTEDEVSAALARLRTAGPPETGLVEDLQRLNDIQHALSRRLDAVED